MCLFRAAIAIVFLLVAVPAEAEENPPSKRQPKSEIDSFKNIGEWADELETIFVVNSDPVMRAIVCRVPFENFSLEALMKATKVSEERLLRAIDELTRRGLIDSSDESGTTMISPAGEMARDAMRRFAENWCGTGDECGVRR